MLPNKSWDNKNSNTLSEYLTYDAITYLDVTKISIISLYLTKLYVVTSSFAIASSVTYSEIRQNFLTVQGNKWAVTYTNTVGI